MMTAMIPGTTANQTGCLVAYDCPANREGERRRRRLRHLLARLERIQYSVYFGHVARNDLPGLKTRLGEVIRTDVDRLLIMDLGSGTWDQHGRTMPTVRLPPAALAILVRRVAAPEPEPLPVAVATVPESSGVPAPGDPMGVFQAVGRNLDHWLGSIGELP